jgi:hypothetical protein
VLYQETALVPASGVIELVGLGSHHKTLIVVFTFFSQDEHPIPTGRTLDGEDFITDVSQHNNADDDTQAVAIDRLYIGRKNSCTLANASDSAYSSGYTVWSIQGNPELSNSYASNGSSITSTVSSGEAIFGGTVSPSCSNTRISGLSSAHNTNTWYHSYQHDVGKAYPTSNGTIVHNISQSSEYCNTYGIASAVATYKQRGT